MLLNWTDIVDGAIANAAWGVVSMVAKPRTVRRGAADLDIAAWADTERLTREALAGVSGNPAIPDLSEEEIAGVQAALGVQVVDLEERQLRFHQGMGLLERRRPWPEWQ